MTILMQTYKCGMKGFMIVATQQAVKQNALL